MQVTVVNEKILSPKEEGQNNGNPVYQSKTSEALPHSRQQQQQENWSKGDKTHSRQQQQQENWSKGDKGQQGDRGQQGSNDQGQGRRYGPRPDRNQKLVTKETNSASQKEPLIKAEISGNVETNNKSIGNKNEIKSVDKENDKEIDKENTVKEPEGKDNDKDAKHELFIVPSRPSTIGQEAQRSSPIVGDDKNESVNETVAPVIEVKPKPNVFGNRHPSKTKSRSFDKLNKTENWDEEDYLPDPSQLGTLVFERSRSSEQLNLTAMNARPPIPRSASGGAIKSPKKYAFSALRKRADSISSDISTGIYLYYISLVARKPVFKVSTKASFKPVP